MRFSNLTMHIDGENSAAALRQVQAQQAGLEGKEMCLKQRASRRDARRGDRDARGPHSCLVVCGLHFNLLDFGFYPVENGKLWKGFRLNNVSLVRIFLPAARRVSCNRAKGGAGAPDRGSLPSSRHYVSSQSLEFFPVPLSRNGMRFIEINSLHILILIHFPHHCIRGRLTS